MCVCVCCVWQVVLVGRSVDARVHSSSLYFLQFFDIFKLGKRDGETFATGSRPNLS